MGFLVGSYHYHVVTRMGLRESASSARPIHKTGRDMMGRKRFEEEVHAGGEGYF